MDRRARQEGRQAAGWQVTDRQMEIHDIHRYIAAQNVCEADRKHKNVAKTNRSSRDARKLATSS